MSLYIYWNICKKINFSKLFKIISIFKVTKIQYANDFYINDAL